MPMKNVSPTGKEYDTIRRNKSQSTYNGIPAPKNRSNPPPSLKVLKNAEAPLSSQVQQRKAAVPSAENKAVPQNRLPIQAKPDDSNALKEEEKGFWGKLGDKVTGAYDWAADKVTGAYDWAADKVTEAKDWVVDKAMGIKETANTIGAFLNAGKSTIFDHDAHVKVANEFGTTFDKADHSAERNITPEQAAVLAAHVYNIDREDIGGSVDVDNDVFGGSIDKATPDEIKKVAGMENYILEDILYNYEEGSGDLKMGVYYQMVEDEKEYYIVNMGTNSDNGPKGWKNNFQNIDGNSVDMKDSIRRAQEFREAHPDSKITMIGHSKGGGEAAANAVATKDSDAMIFNPNTPFLSPYISSDLIKDYQGDMSMYVAKGEVLHEALSAVGYRGVSDEKIDFVEPKYKTPEGFHPIKGVQNFLSNHGLDSILYGLQQAKGATENE